MTIYERLANMLKLESTKFFVYWEVDSNEIHSTYHTPHPTKVLPKAVAYAKARARGCGLSYVVDEYGRRVAEFRDFRGDGND